MKKLKALILSLACLLTLCSCSKNVENQADQVSEVASNSEPSIVSSATIGNMGDLLIHSPILNAYYSKENDSYNFDSIFTYIKPYVQKHDYAAVDLEGSLAGSDYSGYPMFRCPDSLIDSAKNAGFDMFLIANNHSNDGLSQGFMRTMDVLSEKGVDYIGSRQSDSYKNYIVKDINGIKIGMVNYTYGTISNDQVVAVNGILSTEETSKLINVFDYNNLDSFYSKQEQVIKNMKDDGAEAIVYYMHWGTEYLLDSSPQQKEIAQKLCDLGVDVIVGGHPHVVEPIEVLSSNALDKKMVCLYSMGNAISNQRKELLMEDITTGHTEDGLLFTIGFSKYSNGDVVLSKVDALPTWVNMKVNSVGKREYEIIPLDKSLDWASSFNMDSNTLSKANDSYNRTMDLIGEGLKDSQSVLGQKTK